MKMYSRFLVLIFYVLAVYSTNGETTNADYKKPDIEQLSQEAFDLGYKPVFYNDTPDQHHTIRPIVKKYPPQYPLRAADRKKVGIALVGYRVLSDGSLIDVEIIEEIPEGVGFGKAGLKAAKKFKYQPKDDSDEKENDVTYLMNRFTFLLEPGGGTKQELNKLIDDVNAGDAKSMYELATAGPVVYRMKLKSEKINELVLQSALLDYHPAQLKLGIRLFSGFGVVKDREKSKNWLELSAANGNEFAKKIP